MARRVEGTVWPRNGGVRSYPWDTWLDGTEWELVQGKDFFSKVHNFRISCYQQAARRELKVRTKIEEGNAIRIQAYRR